MSAHHELLPPDGVSLESWLALGAVASGRCWEICERDASGNVIGHQIRNGQSRKRCKPGSRRGLTFAVPFPANAGCDECKPLLIVEGATDAAAGTDLGYTTIGRPSATGGIELLVELVRGRHVAIVGENDPSGAGRNGAMKIAEALIGIAASERVIFPPDCAKDLREWCCAPSPLTREELHAIISRTEVFTGTATLDTPQTRSKSSRLRTRNLQDVVPEVLQYVWPFRIPCGKLTLILGDPGLGKSFVTMDIAARVSTGCGWPDRPGETFEPGGVLLLSAEDGLADTIRPRLEAAGADLSRIEAIESVSTASGDERTFNLAEDIQLIEERIVARGDIRLIIVDPISAYCGRVDSHANTDVRGLLSPLTRLAERYGVAVVAVSHLNKNGAGNAMYRAMGSIAFIAAARAAWIVVKVKDDVSMRQMLPVKMNLGAHPKGISFELSQPPTPDIMPRIIWHEAPVETTADEALAALHGGDADGDRRSALSDAVAFLRHTLANGPVPSGEVKSQAEAAGIKSRTLDRARSELGVIAAPDGLRGPWSLSLPGHTPPRSVDSANTNGMAKSVELGEVCDAAPHTTEGAT